MIRNQKGFTLIEIIAVLVILGILAAVAIPKFFNMQEEARNKTALAGVAAYQSNFSMAYASHLLNQSNACNTTPAASYAVGCAPQLSTGYGTPSITGGTTSWEAATTGNPIVISITFDNSAAQTGNWTTP